MRIEKLLRSKLQKFDKIFGTVWFALYSMITLYIFYESLVYAEKINDYQYVFTSAIQFLTFILICFIIIFLFARYKYKKLIFLI